MTLQDLIDNQARQADDTSGEYKTAALRWFNLVRSDIADKGRWQHAVRVDHFSTAAAVTTGLYALDGYEHLEEAVLYNETSDNVIVYEEGANLNSADVAKSTTGEPTFWSDAGADAKGDRAIYLWPIPDAVYKLRFVGYKRLADLDADKLDSDKDPFYGPVRPWQSCFAAGLRLYHELDNNEDPNQILLSQRRFDRAINTRKGTNAVAPVNASGLRNVRNPAAGTVGTGRFNPAHYNNR